MSCENYVSAAELSEWYLIFHHNANYGLFSYPDQARLSYNPHKFSVLARLTDIFKIGEFFEFLLVYPDLDSFTRFKQKKNPMTSNYRDDIECEKIHCPWKNVATFECLTLNNKTSSLLEGQKSKDEWFYAIGQVDPYPSDPTMITGPNWTYEGKAQHEVNLFLRVTDRSLVKYLYSKGSIPVPLIYQIKPKFIFIIFYSISSP